MDNTRAYGVKNVFADTTDGTCAGNAMTKIAAKMTRSGIWIKNHDAALLLWVKLVPRNTTPTTISATSNIRVIAAGATDEIGASQNLDVYVMNSSAAATTSNFSYQDFSF
jgi:hypothetical protein